jgi:hypothetical protein
MSAATTGSPTGATQGTASAQGERRRIAVIAVHGVADQPPGASADAIAKLLLNVRGPAGTPDVPRYPSFRESAVRIPARPPTLSECYPAPGQTGESDHYYMRKLLRDYRPDRGDGVYTTSRLEGRRLAQDGKDEADVHVYEMYWADLSRLGTGLLGMFGAAYQLFVHLPNLGRRVVREAARENARPVPRTAEVAAAGAAPGAAPTAALEGAEGGAAAHRVEKPPVWTWYRRANTAAVFLLTTAIPALNVFLFAIALTVLPQKLPQTMQGEVAYGTLALCAAVAAGLAMYRRRESLDIRYWWAFPPLAAGAAGALAWWVFGTEGTPGLQPLGLHHLLALEWWAITAALVVAMFSRFNAGHPGARLFTYLAGAVTTASFFIHLFPRRNDLREVGEAALRTFEIVFASIQGLWMLFCLAGLTATVLGWEAWRQARHTPVPGARDRARRAANTARLTLTLSATAFLAFTLTIGCGLGVFAAKNLLPQGAPYDPLLPFPSRPGQALESMTQADFLVWLMGLSATPIVWISLLLTVIALGLTLWALTPSAAAEVTPSDGIDDDASVRMGRWLTRGFPLVGVAGHLLWINLFLVAPIGLVSVMPIPGYERAGVFSLRYMGQIQATMVALGSLLAAGAVGVLALRSRIAEAASACRPALDIILDIDNYLRDYPRHRTPRARIVHRYVSLLRYVCARRDELNRGYSAVVIIAHSQGTVITTDLLRFLKTEFEAHEALCGDPAAPSGRCDVPFETQLHRVGFGTRPTSGAMDPLPIYLFTMGSPLRQLYAANFPHLYGWVNRDGGASPSPNPATLGVRQWVNAYRAGDYVGRDLWCRQADDRRYRRCLPAEVSSFRRELCIGAGAHTHYWDKTAADVGAELDRLIALEIPSGPPRGLEAYFSLELARIGTGR